MSYLRVAAAALNQTPLDFDGNSQRILNAIRWARESEVQLLCLPELCISGYGCGDYFLSPDTLNRSSAALAKIVEQTSDISVIVGLPLYFKGSVYNCAAVIQNKKILGLHPKRSLPRAGVHYEYRWFKPWPKQSIDTIQSSELFGNLGPSEHNKKPLNLSEDILIGDIVFDFAGIKLAIEICEEAWGVQNASVTYRDQVDIVANPSASYFEIGRYRQRESLIANGSRATQALYIYANLLGLESGRILYDGSVYFASDGHIQKQTPRFGFGDTTAAYFDCDLQAIKVQKMNSLSVEDHSEAKSSDIKAQSAKGSAFTLRNAPSPKANPQAHAYFKNNTLIEPPPTFDESNSYEEFLLAVTMGLYDYMRKTKSSGYVVSLSGGCDSAACLSLGAKMIELAQAQLESAIEKPLEPEANLTAIYLGSKNSSAATLNAAKALATELRACFYETSIQNQVEQYVQATESLINRSLTWENDDLTLQNIQARSRAPLVWMLANIKNAILLTTSNRSELAVGYATMDGDTAGGLSPLAGIDKPFLREFLKWLESDCKIGNGPYQSLKHINALEPTAELRPSASAQKDEQDLMPYEILNSIEQWLIVDKKGESEVLDLLRNKYSNIEAGTLDRYFERFKHLWKISQWKRERCAPSFHIGHGSLDPKSWGRFPIF